MKRRTLLATLLALPFASLAQAATKPLSLRELSRYLNGLKDAECTFTQINPDGSKSKGRFYLKRPGRMRFEYEPPNNALVVAGQGKLAVFDKKSNQGPQQYPLIHTPLHLILKNQVNLNTRGMIKAHTFDGTLTSITAQDPEHPKSGNVKLMFSGSPTQLVKWIVTDETGQKTTVHLNTMKTGKRISGSLFDINKMIKESKPSR